MLALTLSALPVLAALALPSPAAAIAPGATAPDFTLTDTAGKPRRLSEFKGRTVVLEWNNPGCPFVQKHYAGNMQRTQQRARADGVVWLTINSGAPGKQGHMTGAQARTFLTAAKAMPAAYLLDPDGRVGHLYGARTTPDMVVIDRTGHVRYVGGIDDRPTANPADIATARNHVLAALGELKAGRAVSMPTARSYGCAIKYGG